MYEKLFLYREPVSYIFFTYLLETAQESELYM
jgi:hypothetical protein